MYKVCFNYPANVPDSPVVFPPFKKEGYWIYFFNKWGLDKFKLIAEYTGIKYTVKHV